MSRVRHCWPGTEPRLRLVHDSRRLQPRVIPLDTNIRARLMRALDRLLDNLTNLRSPL